MANYVTPNGEWKYDKNLVNRKKSKSKYEFKVRQKKKRKNNKKRLWK